MADVAADALRLAASVNALGSAAANAVFICPAAAPEEEAMREGGRPRDGGGRSASAQTSRSMCELGGWREGERELRADNAVLANTVT